MKNSFFMIFLSASHLLASNITFVDSQMRTLSLPSISSSFPPLSGYPNTSYIACSFDGNNYTVSYVTKINSNTGSSSVPYQLKTLIQSKIPSTDTLLNIVASSNGVIVTGQNNAEFCSIPQQTKIQRCIQKIFNNTPVQITLSDMLGTIEGPLPLTMTIFTAPNNFTTCNSTQIAVNNQLSLSSDFPLTYLFDPSKSMRTLKICPTNSNTSIEKIEIIVPSNAIQNQITSIQTNMASLTSQLSNLQPAFNYLQTTNPLITSKSLIAPNGSIQSNFVSTFASQNYTSGFRLNALNLLTSGQAAQVLSAMVNSGYVQQASSLLTSTPPSTNGTAFASSMGSQGLTTSQIGTFIQSQIIAGNLTPQQSASLLSTFSPTQSLETLASLTPVQTAQVLGALPPTQAVSVLTTPASSSAPSGTGFIDPLSDGTALTTTQIGEFISNALTNNSLSHSQAGAIFSNLNPTQALESLAGLTPAQAAQVLNQMTPSTAASALMTSASNQAPSGNGFIAPLSNNQSLTPTQIAGFFTQGLANNTMTPAQVASILDNTNYPSTQGLETLAGLTPQQSAQVLGAMSPIKSASLITTPASSSAPSGTGFGVALSDSTALSTTQLGAYLQNALANNAITTNQVASLLNAMGSSASVLEILAGLTNTQTSQILGNITPSNAVSILTSPASSSAPSGTSFGVALANNTALSNTHLSSFFSNALTNNTMTIGQIASLLNNFSATSGLEILAGLSHSSKFLSQMNPTKAAAILLASASSNAPSGTGLGFSLTSNAALTTPQLIGVLNGALTNNFITPTQLASILNTQVNGSNIFSSTTLLDITSNFTASQIGQLFAAMAVLPKGSQTIVNILSATPTVGGAGFTGASLSITPLNMQQIGNFFAQQILATITPEQLAEIIIASTSGLNSATVIGYLGLISYLPSLSPTLNYNDPVMKIFNRLNAAQLQLLLENNAPMSIGVNLVLPSGTPNNGQTTYVPMAFAAGGQLSATQIAVIYKNINTVASLSRWYAIWPHCS